MIRHIKNIVEAHNNLTVYNTIILILEGGNLCGSRHDPAEKIIRICKAEMQKQLAMYERAVTALGKRDG